MSCAKTLSEECITQTFSFPTGLIPRTHAPFNVYSAQRLDLFAWCVRLSRLLVGFRTHFKSLHFLLLLLLPNCGILDLFQKQSVLLHVARDDFSFEV